jgi:hypothetical protein
MTANHNDFLDDADLDNAANEQELARTCTDDELRDEMADDEIPEWECRGCRRPEVECICDTYDEADPGDMDGDHESALASAGWGCDEDYGCFDGGGDGFYD